MLASGVWILSALTALTAVYPSAQSAVRFALFVAGFGLLPGIIVSRLLLPRLGSLGLFLIYATSVGLVIDVIVFLPLWIIGHPDVFSIVPLASLGALAVLRRRLMLGRLLGTWKVGRSDVCWIFGALLSCITPLLTMGLFLADDPNGGFSMHFAYQGVIVRELALGWPPPDLLLADAPRVYNYAVHLWILAAHQNTGLEVEELVARFGPVFFCGCAVALMLSFGVHILRLPWWLATLPVIAVFGLAGIPAISGQIFGTATMLGSLLLMSPALGFIVVLIALTFITECLQASSGRIMQESVIVGVLTFTATGARAPAAPILLCGLILLLAILLKRRSKIRDVGYFTWAAILGFIAGMVVFFRTGTEFNGASSITFTGQPFTFLLSPDQYLLTFPRTLIGLGFPALLAALISFLVITAFQAGFLTPPLAYNLVTMSRRTVASEDILLIGMSIAGISAVFLTVAPGYSQFSFLHYTNIAASLLGAQGLRLVLEPVRYRERIRELLVVSTGIGLALHLAQLPVESLNWIRKQLPYAIAVLFAGSASDEKAERQTIRSRARDVDEELFAIASRTGKHPVVIIVPDNKTVFSYHPC